MVGQCRGVIHFRGVSRGQLDVAAGHAQRVVAVLGLVVGELGLHFHGLCAHVGDGRRRGAPCQPVVGAVGDGRRVAVAGRGRGDRLELRAVVHLRDGGAARTGQLKVGRVGGHRQGAARRVNAVVGEGGACTRCPLERVARAAHVGDACEVAVRERLACDEAAAAHRDVVVGEGVAVIHLRGCPRGQRDVATGYFDGATMWVYVRINVGTGLVIQFVKE